MNWDELHQERLRAMSPEDYATYMRTYEEIDTLDEIRQLLGEFSDATTELNNAGEATGDEGNPVALATMRTQQYRDRKRFCASTPVMKAAIARWPASFGCSPSDESRLRRSVVPELASASPSDTDTTPVSSTTSSSAAA